jgi:hypothetical protein
MNRMPKIAIHDPSHTLLSGAPLLESPFFDETLAGLELDEPTKAAALHLHEHGRAVIDFPDPEIDAVAGGSSIGCIPVTIGIDGAPKVGGKMKGLRIQDAYKFNVDVLRIAANPQIPASQES